MEGNEMDRTHNALPWTAVLASAYTVLHVLDWVTFAPWYVLAICALFALVLAVMVSIACWANLEGFGLLGGASLLCNSAAGLCIAFGRPFDAPMFLGACAAGSTLLLMHIADAIMP
jgi:hypothetical protein